MSADMDDEFIVQANNNSALEIGQISAHSDDVYCGWTAGDDLLCSQISKENSVYDGVFLLNYRKAQRKIQPERLKAEIRRHEKHFMYVNEVDWVNSKVRKGIKADVIDMLLPETPVAIKGVQVVFDRFCQKIFIGSISEKTIDEIIALIYKSFGIEARRQCALGLAQARDPENDDRLIGLEFLTWLYRRGETNDNPGLIIEAPLSFINPEHECQGSTEAVIKGDLASRSAEAKSSLSSEKRLRKAKFTMGYRADEIYRGSFDAYNFCFSGLQLPSWDCDASEMFNDASEMFNARLESLTKFLQGVYDLFDEFFVDYKTEDYRERMNKWIEEKESF